jgi:hypothetical protein
MFCLCLSCITMRERRIVVWSATLIRSATVMATIRKLWILILIAEIWCTFLIELFWLFYTLIVISLLWIYFVFSINSFLSFANIGIHISKWKQENVWFSTNSSFHLNSEQSDYCAQLLNDKNLIWLLRVRNAESCIPCRFQWDWYFAWFEYLDFLGFKDNGIEHIVELMIESMNGLPCGIVNMIQSRN